MKLKLLSILLFSTIFSTQVLYADKSSDAAAKNNTEASKLMSPGTVSVNPQTGDASFQVSMRKFGGLNLGLSYSNGLALSNVSGNANIYGLPDGIAISGIPAVHNGNDHRLVVSVSGHDYYVDDGFVSIGNDGGFYKSGLRYQTDKMLSFENKASSVQSLTVNDNDQATTVDYSYILKYKNGVIYYFNRTGLCVAITDAFYKDDQTNNRKHVTLINYLRDNVAPEYAQLKSLTNAAGQALTVKYDSYGITFSYPVGPSGKSYQVALQGTKGEDLTAIRTSLNSQFDTGYQISYNNSQLNYVKETLFSKDSFYPPKGYLGDKVYQFAYDDTSVGYKVSSLEITDNQATDNSLLQTYQYNGNSQNTFSYGVDTMMDFPDAQLDQVQYNTIEKLGHKETVHWYNYLHQELLTETKYLDSEGKPHLTSRVYYKYPSTILKDGKHKLSTHYDKPIEQISMSYDKDQAVSMAKQTWTYDDYNQPLVVKTYPIVSAQGLSQILLSGVPLKSSPIDYPNYPSTASPVQKEDKVYDEKNFLNLIEDNKIDYTAHRSVEIDNVLGDEGRHVKSKSTTYKDLTSNAMVSGKTTSYSYGSDTAACSAGDNFFDASLICQKTMTYLNTNDKSVSLSYGYVLGAHDASHYGALSTTVKRSYVDSSGLTQSSQVGDGSSQTKSVSIDGQKISETDANGITSTKTYNLAGQPLVETDKDKIKLSYDYDYMHRTISEYLKPTDSEQPELLTKKLVMDFLGNHVQSYERTEKSGSIGTLEAGIKVYSYADGPRLESEQDKFGNRKDYHYNDEGKVSEVVAYRNTVDSSHVRQVTSDMKMDYSLQCDSTYGCYQKTVTAENNKNGKGLIETSYSRGQDKDNKPFILFDEKALGNGAVLSQKTNDYTQTGILQSHNVYNDKGQLIDRKTYVYDTMGRKLQENYKKT